MAKQRRRAQDARLAEAQAEADEVRRQARAWFIRAFLALVTAVPIGLITGVVAAVLVVLAVVCVVQGVRQALAAEKVLQAAGGGTAGTP